SCFCSFRCHSSPSVFPTRRSSDLGAGGLAGDHRDLADRRCSRGVEKLRGAADDWRVRLLREEARGIDEGDQRHVEGVAELVEVADRKSTRLNSSHVSISYAVFCLK